jgi:hypothetical protein
MKPVTKLKVTFQYGHHKTMTVAVTAGSLHEAVLKARDEIDRRYEAKGLESPVGWTLTPVKILGWSNIQPGRLAQ